MDITEVPLTQDTKGKKKKSKNKGASNEGNEEGGGTEKKVEKMEKSEPAATAFPPSFSVSEIKNKQRRHLMFMKLKQEKRKVKPSQQT